MSVINNSDFLKEYKSRIAKIKNQTVHLYVAHELANQNDAYRSSRVDPVEALKLIEPNIDRLDETLKGWRTDARFTVAQGHCTILAGPLGNKPGGYNVLKDVFDSKPRHLLLGFFASLAAPIAAIWVRKHVSEQRANAAADAAAAALQGNPLQAAVRTAVFEAAREIAGECKQYQATRVASLAAEAAGATRPVVDAVSNVPNGQNALGDAVRMAAEEADITLPVGVLNAVQATAASLTAHAQVSYRVTDELARTFQNLPAGILAREGVSRRERFFRTNLETLCLRLMADWDDINNLFFPNLVLKKLIHIQTTGADFHKEGKQVLILTFKVHASPTRTVGYGVFKRQKVVIEPRQLAKLIYKPSDVELDWRIVGDSHATQARLPNLWGAEPFNAHSLFCRINDELALPNGAPALPARGAIDGLAAAPAATPLVNGGTPLALPVYQILPRNPGSQLAGGQGGLPIQTSYGYIEYLTYLPECTSAQNLTIALDMANRAAWDYVTEGPGVAAGVFALRNFYRILGWYATFGVILNFGDQHRENVIVHRREPCLIDLEICFKHRANELRATMLEYHFSNLNPEDDKNVLLCHDGGLHHTMGKQAGAYMLLGFDEALGWIGGHHATISGWLNQLQNVVVRYTPRPTDKFTKRVWELYATMATEAMPANANDFNRRPFTLWKCEDLGNFYAYNGRTSRGRPLFALNGPNHDWACYLNTDAPAYYRRLGSADLLNARGVAVAVADPGGRAGLGYVDLPTDGAPVVCEKVLPTAANGESLAILARTGGPRGQNIRIELRDNTSNALSQAMSAIVNVNQGVTTVSITFGTDGNGATQPPSSGALRYFIAENKSVKQHLRAELRPATAGGLGLMAATAPAWLWLPNSALVFPNTGHFFDLDPDGDPNNARTPLQISLDRLQQIANGTEANSAQAWTSMELMGQPMQNATTLKDVVQLFRQQITDLSHEWTDNKFVPVNF